MELVREVTGFPGLHKADAQGTLYRPGHFLALHDDSHVAEGWRVAYVLNMTAQDWRPEYGGYLMFYDEDGDVIAGFKPRFNALNLFAVPQKHNVTYVPPFAPVRALCDHRLVPGPVDAESLDRAARGDGRDRRRARRAAPRRVARRPGRTGCSTLMPALLALTCLCGVSILWITLVDMRSRGRGGRMRPIRTFDIALGLALLLPAAYALRMVWPELGSSRPRRLRRAPPRSSAPRLRHRPPRPSPDRARACVRRTDKASSR